ncbi:aldose epimerase family protein [Mucilaginibacter sp. UR6-11]|uniref:aldose epimerase family protein n=1 Tax=Mucilaginibacter sp. UR6-11 TaxID=1435644 RepID=UPI001E650347|nr:aldose epimerase family protein [Mucilaginibacter sp. UR6-11]MCC8425863.1 galactose mutarotase [Mucilaginibacter sp. UR6-11]
MKNLPFFFPLFYFLSIVQVGTAKPVPYHATARKPLITKIFYGETEGQRIYQYTLTNSKGMQVKVINYGATITDIITPDKNGKMSDVVLGFDSLKQYLGRDNALLGAVVGRVANRINNKKFTLDGKEYVLTSNIHGGPRGFDKKVWAIQEVPGNKEVALKLTYLSKDGESGYPGNLNLTVTYTLTNNNEVKLTYAATTDKPTPVVLTNHTYFNLAGTTDKVVNTELTIAADQYLEADKDNMPSGRLLDVKGTPYDFTQPKPIGRDITVSDNQLIWGHGYDVTFVLHNATGKLVLAATVYEPASGRIMQCYTTEPGVVIYTGNYLNERIIGRGGKPFTQWGALCLETMHFPDSPNHTNFPGVILRPGQLFTSQTIYRFFVNK